MRLIRGYQNLISYSHLISGSGYLGDNFSFANSDATFHGTTLSPDGSTLAIGYEGDFGTWDKVLTYVRSDFISGYDIYNYSLYIKAISDHRTRAMLYPYSSVTDDNFGLNIQITNKKITSIDHYSGNLNPGYFNYTYVGNDWIKLEHTFDTRGIELDVPLRIRNYINAPMGGLEASGEGIYMWGMQLEKTKLRNRAAPLHATDTVFYDTSTDYLTVDFTQLPSNIGEVDNDIFETKTSTSGLLQRVDTYSDKNLKTLSWELINYVKHGYMLYMLRESLRDKLSQDCVLEYPVGFNSDKFKSNIKSAKIRVVDFRFTYLDKRDYASVEIDYYVISTQEY